LEGQIAAAIRELGGDVFVKLDWTAPMDAVWMAEGNSARCSTPGHVFTLLKASELVQYDLAIVEKLQDGITAPLHLILRPWYSLHRSREFRCFIRCRSLVAACLRHAGVSSPSGDSEETSRLQTGVEAFIAEEVIPSFALHTCELV